MVPREHAPTYDPASGADSRPKAGQRGTFPRETQSGNPRPFGSVRTPLRMTFHIDTTGIDSAGIDPAEARLDIASIPQVRRRMSQSFLSASAEGRHVSILVLGVDNLELVSDGEGLSEDVVMKACGALLGDTFSKAERQLMSYRDGARLIALVELPLDQSELIARRSILTARQLVVGERTVDLSLSIGIAENRTDVELYFETLVLVAEEGLAVARARGGECCVHTMLYRSLQEMKERDEAALSGRKKIARTTNSTSYTPTPSSAPERSVPEPESPPGSLPLVPAFVPSNETDSEALVRTRAEALAQRLSSSAIRDLRLDYERRLDEERALRRELEISENSANSVELLQLRIQKLSSSLEMTEKRLIEVCTMKNVDAGVSSIYRQVQGLANVDEDYAVKKEMMKNIFEANMHFQKKAG